MPNDRALAVAERFNDLAERIGAPGRCDATLSFDSPQLVRALAIWREKAQAREMPSRQDIGPHALKAFLPLVAIVDVVHENQARRYRIRLVGTALAELLGEHTGKFIDEAVASPFRERWLAVVEAVVAADQPLRFAARVEYHNKDTLSVELLGAPMGLGVTEAVLIVASARSSDPRVVFTRVKNAFTGAVPRRE